MAGARLAEEIRGRDPDGERVEVVLVGEEPRPAYNRILLSNLIAGTMSPQSVWLHDETWSHRNNIDLRIGATVSGVDRTARRVGVSDGSEIGYDRLVLATGSTPRIPPVSGIRDDEGRLAPGVIPYRDFADCRQIVERAAAGASVAVLGGGVLGLEAARALAERGNAVTVIHPGDRLMDRQLDTDASTVLTRTLESLGVGFRLGRSAAAYQPGNGIELDDGSRVNADLLVLSTGVRAETTLAHHAGLAVDHGILVDDTLRTSDYRVHALGDCAQHAGTAGGLVQPAFDQATVLADLITGTEPQARYRGTPTITRLKARDVDLAVLGDGKPGTDATEDEVVSVTEPAKGRYAKLVLRHDKIRGAILLGLPDAAAAVTHHYDNETPAPNDRLALLLGRAMPAPTEEPAAMPDSATVCNCNNVTKGAIENAWHQGARSTPELAEHTRATTGCGSCTGTVDRIADELAKAAG
jgi:assimilatory nitrate reductase electron transfer subunit